MLLGFALLFLVYPGKRVKEWLRAPTYPLFGLEEIVLLDDSEDFIEVAFSETGEAIGFYWDDTTKEFHFKTLDLTPYTALLPKSSDETSSEKPLKQSRQDPAKARGEAGLAEEVENNPAKSLPKSPAKSLARSPAEPPTKSVKELPYYFRKSSPWLPLPLALAHATHTIRGEWEHSDQGADVFKVTLIPRESPSESSSESLSDSPTAAFNDTHALDEQEELGGNIRGADKAYIVLPNGANRDNRANGTIGTSKTSGIHTLRMAMPSDGRASTLSRRVALLYTLSPHTFYYTTNVASRTSPAKGARTERYALIPLPLNEKPAAQSLEMESFLAQTNRGHHYNPFYWVEQNALSYVSIEQAPYKPNAASTKVSQNPEKSSSREKTPYLFQTVLNITRSDGTRLYRKPLALTERPQLTIIKVDSDSSGHFLGYTAPDGSGSLYFLFVADSNPQDQGISAEPRSNPQDQDTSTKSRPNPQDQDTSTKSRPNPQDQDTSTKPQAQQPSPVLVPFEITLPEIRALHSFAFTPPGLTSGLLFIAIPSTKKTTQGSVYWARRVLTPFSDHTISGREWMLAGLCGFFALILLGMGIRLLQNFFKHRTHADEKHT